MITQAGSALPRICIISPFSYPLFDENCVVPKVGGAELQMFLLARELAEREYQVDMIVDECGQPDTTSIGAITLHKVALKYMGGSNFYLIPAWINLIATLFRIDADIHILKLPRTVMPPLGIYCRLRRKKLIFVGQIDNDVDPVYLRKSDVLVVPVRNALRDDDGGAESAAGKGLCRGFSEADNDNQKCSGGSGVDP
jgi:hypothetical protein